MKDPAFAEVIRAAEVDLLLNVHSLFVIKPEIVAAPRWGSFNLHPGPLPRYAGLNAPSWAIYRGERSHGVTVHRMLAGIDTGPVAYQSLFDFVRAVDYSPFPSPWRNPRSRMGDQEVAFVKSVLTGRPCDAAPGTIGRSDGGQVWVACADEWVEVGRLMVNGQSANAAEVLKPGERLEWNG